MFKLLRRISVGVIPRPDRPWDEDPTSNAPQTNRKRRLSSTERDDADEGKAGKKVRGDTASPSMADADALFLVAAVPGADTREVKEVTRGVEEVELEDKSREVVGDKPAPETIPLPEERSGELDDPASDGVEDDDDDDDSTSTDDAGATDGTGSPRVAVEHSTSTPPPSGEDCEGQKDEGEEVKEHPPSDESSPTNGVNTQQALNHP